MSVKFDPEHLYTKRHRVLKVKPSGLVEAVDKTGEPYTVRISKGLYTRYKNAYHINTFRNPGHLMCFLYYQDMVVDIEALPSRFMFSEEEIRLKAEALGKGSEVLSQADLESSWTPNFETRLRLLKEEAGFANPKVIWYFDGTHVYPIRKSLMDAQPIDSSGRFMIDDFEAYDLYALRGSFVNASRREADNLSGKRQRIAFVYRFKETKHWDNFAVSPSMNPEGIFRGGTSVHHLMALDNFLNAIEGVFRVNTDFVFDAAKLVRSYYGNHAMDWLGLPAILKSLNVSTLANISPEVRRLTPCQHTLRSSMAWIMGLTRNEHQLHRQVKLMALFKQLLGEGLVATEVYDKAVGKYTEMVIPKPEEVPRLNVEQHLEELRKRRKNVLGNGDMRVIAPV